MTENKDKKERCSWKNPEITNLFLDKLIRDVSLNKCGTNGIYYNNSEFEKMEADMIEKYGKAYSAQALKSRWQVLKGDYNNFRTLKIQSGGDVRQNKKDFEEMCQNNPDLKEWEFKDFIFYDKMKQIIGQSGSATGEHGRSPMDVLDNISSASMELEEEQKNNSVNSSGSWSCSSSSKVTEDDVRTTKKEKRKRPHGESSSTKFQKSIDKLVSVLGSQESYSSARNSIMQEVMKLPFDTDQDFSRALRIIGDDAVLKQFEFMDLDQRMRFLAGEGIRFKRSSADTGSQQMADI